MTAAYSSWAAALLMPVGFVSMGFAFIFRGEGNIKMHGLCAYLAGLCLGALMAIVLLGGCR